MRRSSFFYSIVIISCLSIFFITLNREGISTELPEIKDLRVLSLKVVDVEFVDKLTIKNPINNLSESINQRMLVVKMKGSLPHPAKVAVNRSVDKTNLLWLWAGYEINIAKKFLQCIPKTTTAGKYMGLNIFEDNTFFHSPVATSLAVGQQSFPWSGMVGGETRYVNGKGIITINVAYAFPRQVTIFGDHIIDSFYIYYSPDPKGEKVKGKVVIPATKKSLEVSATGGDLLFALWNRKKDCAQAYLDKGADINEKVSGKTTLMIASDRGYLDIVKTLLAKGAEVNAKSDDAKTALMAAAYNGHAEVIKVLLNAGADVNARNKWGTTALTLAMNGGHPEVVPILEKAGGKK